MKLEYHMRTVVQSGIAQIKSERNNTYWTRSKRVKIEVQVPQKGVCDVENCLKYKHYKL